MKSRIGYCLICPAFSFVSNADPRGQSVSLLHEIRRTLDPLGTGSQPDKDLVCSAVLVMISECGSDFGIWFIKRTEHKDDPFSGHVAFPGGKKKESDATLLDTAAREVGEELGFDAWEEGEILGEMDFFRPLTPSVRSYAVKPFISVVQSEPEFISNREVSEIFRIPVSHLLDAKNRTVRKRRRAGMLIDDHVFRYRGHIIWGLTGRILSDFLERTAALFGK